MPASEIKNLQWYSDTDAKAKGEPGIYHSYMACLATAINHISGSFDPVWLMGAGAFAFRIWINETMCPSAMSIFNWSVILPDAVTQAGYGCNYISRMWDEAALEDERREQAREAIITGIDKGIPAVVWDVADCEWGLIVGYDTDKKIYKTLTFNGTPATLAFDRLGKNGIDILSVAIPNEPNGIDRDEAILKSLKAAVAHAGQEEWNDRPKYQNGLEAFDLWELTFQRWAAIVGAGKAENIKADIDFFAKYYAGHYFSARCYARDYLMAISNGNSDLQKASESYKLVAERLRTLWVYFSQDPKDHDPAKLISLSENIMQAKSSEAKGIDHIKRFIDSYQ